MAAGASRARNARERRLLVLKLPSVCSLTFLRAALPQLIFPVLSEKPLGRKMEVKVVCEVRE